MEEVPVAMPADDHASLQGPQHTLVGLADSGFASLATFIAGLSAFQLLEPQQLGIYALVFSGFVWLALLPTNVYLIPLEIALLSWPRVQRLSALVLSLRVASLLGLASAAMLIGLADIIANLASGGTSLLTSTSTLIVTGGAVTLVSPLQDHARRLFHLGGRPQLAATTSVIQFIAVAVALVILTQLRFPPASIPLGALFIGNVLSISFALVASVRVSRHDRLTSLPRWTTLRTLGGWLLFQNAAQKGGSLLASVLLAATGGLVAVGEVEGARLVAQPLLVLGVGLTASLGPRSMEAALEKDSDAIKTLRRTYATWLVSLGSIYLLYTQLPEPINIMRSLVAAAYTSTGLVVIQTVGAIANGVSSPYQSELLASRKEASLSRIELAASTALVTITAATAPHIGAYSVPLGVVIAGVIRIMWRKRLADRVASS